MKILIIGCILIGTFFCSKPSKKNESLLDIKKVELSSTSITEVTFTKGEIIGENHYGFKYNFDIKVNTLNNLDLATFYKNNFPSILQNRVDDTSVINAIITSLNNNDNIRLDSSPKGLRLLGASTDTYDAIEVEIYVKDNNLLFLDLKYYYPL